MPCVRARNSVALPSVYSQLTLGILRRNIPSQTFRQPMRSSANFPNRRSFQPPNKIYN